MSTAFSSAQMRSVFQTLPVHFIRKEKELFQRCELLPSTVRSSILRYVLFNQAFAEVIQMASNGSLAGVSADDINAFTTLFYLLGSPSFPNLNNAIFGALSGDASGFPFAEIAPQFSAGLFTSLPLACSDNRK